VHQSKEKKKKNPSPQKINNQPKKLKKKIKFEKKNLIVDIMKGSYEPCSQKSN